MGRRLQLLGLLLTSALVWSGCFVFDEIDAGMEIMDAHSVKRNKEKAQAGDAPPPAADGEKPPTYSQVVQEWWKDASTLAIAPGDREAAEDPMVPCRHAGKTLFTKRSDCLARGGNPG